MARLAVIGLLLTPPAVLAGAAHAAIAEAGAKEPSITLPSGAMVRWVETRQDNAGGFGLTYRFRFVMPDLAARVPATSGPASDFEEEPRGPIDIDTESGTVSENSSDDGLIDPATLEDMAEADAPDMAEEQEADAMLDEPVPAAPDVLAQDPVHDDIVWLCENWVLPRIASPAPRPGQIVISLADREIPFGTFDPEAVQIFEAFRLPPDQDTCEWEPW